MHSSFSYGIPNILGAPHGLPMGIPTQSFAPRQFNAPNIPPPEIPGNGLKRALCFLADYGGCGFYRGIGPNLLLNLNNKAVVIDSTTMILDPNFYQTVEAIKFQRQATEHQKKFVEFLKQATKNKKTKFIYEVDDVVFSEDIPMYNRNRDAFTDPAIRQTIIEIISMMDEVTVTSEYFRDYMIDKTGNKNVTALPNYLMKWWFDRYYNLGDLIKKFEKNKKKPIVAIFASGTHCDVLNRVNQQDDFAMVVPEIIKTRTDFQYHFYGSYPLTLKPFIDKGDMKFFNWVQLPDFPEAMANSGAQVTFAALQDNNFNRCKSNIKLIEAGALGLPCICPDMVTYKDAFLKYKSGAEFIDCLKSATKDQTVYAKHCKQAREHASNFWLDDEPNLMKHYESYFTDFGSSERKYLGC